MDEKDLLRSRLSTHLNEIRLVYSGICSVTPPCPLTHIFVAPNSTDHLVGYTSKMIYVPLGEITYTWVKVR